MKYISDLNHLSNVPSFIIIEFDSCMYEDPYERPGSGQMVTKHYPNIITFESEEEWRLEIEKRILSTLPGHVKKAFKAFKMIPAEIKTTIKVDVANV